MTTDSRTQKLAKLVVNYSVNTKKGEEIIEAELVFSAVGVTANLEGIGWVIVGGESGPNSRPIERNWVIQLRNQCRKDGVPFFFKQWGGINKKKNGRILDGRIYNEFPNTQYSQMNL